MSIFNCRDCLANIFCKLSNYQNFFEKKFTPNLRAQFLMPKNNFREFLICENSNILRDNTGDAAILRVNCETKYHATMYDRIETKLCFSFSLLLNKPLVFYP